MIYKKPKRKNNFFAIASTRNVNKAIATALKQGSNVRIFVNVKIAKILTTITKKQ